MLIVLYYTSINYKILPRDVLPEQRKICYGTSVCPFITLDSWLSASLFFVLGDLVVSNFMSP